VFFPRDLALRVAEGLRGSVRLAGRVVALTEDGVVLADAWHHCPVTLPQDARGGLGEGCWLLVEGELAGGGITGRVLACFAGQAAGALGEQGRLAFTGRAQALLAREAVTRAVRAYFVEQGFLEVQTPSLVPCPGLDAHVHSLGSVERAAGERDWLITSPELHLKRLVVGGMPRVFELARCYRAEELGARHEPEFTLVEWYRAFATAEDVMADTEQLVARAAEAVGGARRLRLTEGRGAAREIDVTPPFDRVTVRQAFARYAGVPDAVLLANEDPDRYFELLVGEVEPALAAEARPVFLTEYPLSQASLARVCPHDPTVAERFELYVGGLELCNGFGELTDPAEQRRRFEAEQSRRRAAGEPVYPLDERFLAALEEGLPPTAGNALGLDRLVLLAAGVPHLGLVQAFPSVDR
jgi:lysyl-tRNA synthetase class 2